MSLTATSLIRLHSFLAVCVRDEGFSRVQPAAYFVHRFSLVDEPVTGRFTGASVLAGVECGHAYALWDAFVRASVTYLPIRVAL